MSRQPKIFFNFNSKNKKYPTELSIHASVLPIALKTRDLVCSLGHYFTHPIIALFYPPKVLCWISSLCNLAPTPAELLVMNQHNVEFSIVSGEISKWVTFALSEV